MAAPLVSSAIIPHQVERPSWGLFLDRNLYDVPERGLTFAHNVRIRSGSIETQLMGWDRFTEDAAPQTITGMEEVFDRLGVRALLVGMDDDLMVYDTASDRLLFITPRYQTGTASAVGAAVTGVGTLWNTADPNREGQLAVQAGDLIAFGAADYRNVDGPWYEIVAVPNDTSLTLAGAGVPAPIGAGPYTIRQRFGGTTEAPWYFMMFPDAQGTLQNPAQGPARVAGDDLAYGCNGAVIVSYKVGQTVAARLDAGFRARVLTRFKNRAVYGNLVVAGAAFPVNIRSSAPAEPENFATNGATEIAVTDAAQELVGLKPLGDSLMAYCRAFDHQLGAIVQIAEIAEPIVWALRIVSPFIATLAGRTIVDLGNTHEFLGADGAYAFDGVQLIPHGAHVLRIALQNVDGDRLDQALAIQDFERGEINWVLPLRSDASGYPVRAFLEHYREPRERGQPVPFTRRDLPATATAYFTQASALRFSDFTEDFDETTLLWSSRSSSPGFPSVLFALGSTIMVLNVVSTLYAGIPYVSRVRFPPRPVVPRSGGIQRGLVQSVTPFVRQLSGPAGIVAVRVLRADHRGETLAAVSSVPYALSFIKRFAAIRKMARYAAVEFESVSVGFQPVTWELDGYRMLVARAGER